MHSAWRFKALPCRSWGGRRMGRRARWQAVHPGVPACLPAGARTNGVHRVGHARAGEVLRSKDAARAEAEIHRSLLPLLLTTALDDNEEVGAPLLACVHRRLPQQQSANRSPEAAALVGLQRALRLFWNCSAAAHCATCPPSTAATAKRAAPDQHTPARPRRPQVSRETVLSFRGLAALLPPGAASSAAQAAIQRLEAQGAEDAAVQAARLFAHTAACWPEPALRARAPELLKRWCSHRDFAVREVGGQGACGGEAAGGGTTRRAG